MWVPDALTSPPKRLIASWGHRGVQPPPATSINQAANCLRQGTFVGHSRAEECRLNSEASKTPPPHQVPAHRAFPKVRAGREWGSPQVPRAHPTVTHLHGLTAQLPRGYTDKARHSAVSSKYLQGAQVSWYRIAHRKFGDPPT